MIRPETRSRRLLARRLLARPLWVGGLLALCLIGPGLTAPLRAAPVPPDPPRGTKPDKVPSVLVQSVPSVAPPSAPGPVAGPALRDLPEDAHAVVDLLLAVRPADPGAAGATDRARRAAADQAAWIWGARYGLLWRQQRIAGRLAALSGTMNIFAFDALALEDHGRRILPPVIAVGHDAFHLAGDGQKLATARTVLRILSPARLIVGPPDWRTWLPDTAPRPDHKPDRTPADRSGRADSIEDGVDISPGAGSAPVAPPAAVFPQGPEETARWAASVRAGFAQGVREADAVFADRLARLVTDFTGMIAWCRLYAEGKVSAPQIAHRDRAVEGGGPKMSILTRTSVIADPARLNPVQSDWTAQPRRPEPPRSRVTKTLTPVSARTGTETGTVSALPVRESRP